MPVVFDNIEVPGSIFGDRRRVVVYLVASSEDDAAGGEMPATNITIYDSETKYANGAGYVEFALRPNDDVEPDGTYYVWETHLADGRVARRSIVVPDVAGPIWVGDLTVDPPPTPGLLSGTWAAMQAFPAPRVNQIWTATDQFDARYQFNGTRWRLMGLLPGQYAYIEFGADPLGVLNSRQAVLDTIAAAITPLGTSLIGGGDGEIWGEIVETPGALWVEGGDITWPHRLKASGIGGQEALFVWQRVPYVIFETGGFVLDSSSSASLTWDGVARVSYDGTPLRTDDGAGPGYVTHSLLRAMDGAHSAVECNDTFFGEFEDNEFRVPEGADVPVVQLSTTNAGGLEGWSFQFGKARFNGGNGCIQWDIDHTHMKEVGAGSVVREAVGENMGLSPLTAPPYIMKFRNPHATNDANHGGLEVVNSYIDDSPNTWDAVQVETLGSGAMLVGVVRLNGTTHGANGYHVDCIETGGGLALFNGLVLLGEGPQVNFTTPGGSKAIGIGQSISVLTDRAVTDDRDSIMESFIDGDVAKRLHIGATGGIHRYDGSASPIGKVVDRVGNGAPSIDGYGGSKYVDAASGIRWFKFPGTTGSSGWVSLPILIEYANASTPGTVIKRVRLYDEAGGLLGYIPIYDTIT